MAGFILENYRGLNRKKKDLSAITFELERTAG
jgi:hypothetical protein